MNRLGAEASPYLRQHAENPVDWFPWGDEAFARARSETRPILLSVGYSACHWCHVMAHESFEDPDTAAVMNELFVNVKVDREERPDVDGIYMEAVQAMTGRGGWPMTVFLTPDGEPFFGGTYFPKEARGGAPAFVDVLRRVRAAWDDQRDDVVEQADKLTELLGRAASMPAAAAAPGAGVIDAAIDDLAARFDPDHGGFGPPPKFPQPYGIELLIRRHATGDDGRARQMAVATLDAMAAGGLYDHLAGGFARYSTDREWIVPHFEKMLYDNALLVRAYLHAWQVTGLDGYLQVVDETISYVLDDLRDPDGGFYAAEDADSEGEEGRYYVWTPAQIEAVLGDDAIEFSSWFGVTDIGNFEGRNILFRPTRGELNRPMSVELSRQRLRSARDMRIRPGLDDKVLTEWNALMLSSVAEAAMVTSHQRWVDAAVRNARFLLERLRRDDGRWMRSWQRDPDPAAESSARHLAYAADLAALVDGFTRVNEATGEAAWLHEAVAAADQLIALFWDDNHGGFFTTGSDADPLITRPKDVQDGAVPSANSTAAVALLRLAALTGESRYRDYAEGTVRWLGDVAQSHPTAVGHLLYAIELLHNPITEVVIPGRSDELLDVARLAFRPYSVLAWGEPTDAPLWSGREEGLAYVCQNATCQLPATTPEALADQLRTSA